jgi:sugar phosphate isomerase/epimerase
MCAATLSVFTKPWPQDTLESLAARMGRLGIEAIELPVRPGFQVTPESATTGLPLAVRTLSDLGITVSSIAGEPERGTVEACARAQVPLIRVMARIMPGERYTEAELRLRAEYAALEPVLRDAGVRVGIQNHCGSFVPNALGLRSLLADLDPDRFVAVWDAAHEALAGMPPEFALDVIAPRLGMVNLKNGYWDSVDRPEGRSVEWHVTWCGAREGLADWSQVVSLLKQMAYAGVVCLTAEYSQPAAVDRLIEEDAVYARALLRLDHTAL